MSSNLPTQWSQSITDRLDTWDSTGLTRTMAEFSTGQDPICTIDGDSRVLFSSSNYLGLAQHPQVVGAAQTALEIYGAGSGGSRLTTGTTDLHNGVERRIASWLGYPECCFFATGYQANVGLISTLADEATIIFSDQRNHASIIDGCRLAKATRGTRSVVFPHRDAAALRTLLTDYRTIYPDHRFLVMSDGVFSMDGTSADLPSLVDTAHEFGALVIVDDAHGIGTIGASGRGVIDVLPDHAPDILVGTASKALGAEGGFVCAPEPVVRLLRNQARSFVFSTSTSAANMAAVGAAVGVVRSAGSPVPQLQANSLALREKLRDAGILESAETDGAPETAESAVPADPTECSPIIPIPIGAESTAMAVAAELRSRGFHVPAIRYPTVPRGAAILRVTVMATHSSSQITDFVDAITDALAHVSD